MSLDPQGCEIVRASFVVGGIHPVVRLILKRSTYKYFCIQSSPPPGMVLWLKMQIYGVFYTNSALAPNVYEANGGAPAGAAEGSDGMESHLIPHSVVLLSAPRPMCANIDT